MPDYRYRLTLTGASSQKYGPCEVCGGHASEVFHQVEEWPGVKRYGDIKEVKGTELEPVDLICGGPPCQPFSEAGKKRGFADDRYLWPEMFRLIQEVRPAWVLLEEVANFVKMAVGQVLADLESEAYDFPRDLAGNPVIFVVPVAGINGWTRRYRCFVVAYSDGDGRDKSKDENGVACEAQSHTKGQRSWLCRYFRGHSGRVWYAPESIFSGMDYGVPGELDRLKSLGNAVHPGIVEVLGRMILVATSQKPNNRPGRQ